MSRVVPTTVVNSAGMHRQVHPIASAQLPVYLEQCLLKLEHIWLQIDPESARLIKAVPLCTKHAFTQATQESSCAMNAEPCCATEGIEEEGGMWWEGVEWDGFGAGRDGHGVR
jgi:hypothetical protein